jgi:hypothetical protein
MSQIASVPRVREVTNARVTNAPTVTSVVTPVLRSLIEGVSEATRVVVEALSERPVDAKQPAKAVAHRPSQIQESLTTIEHNVMSTIAGAGSLRAADATKIAALGALANTTYRIDPDGVRPELDALVDARTPEAAKRAREKLMTRVGNGHTRVVQDAVAIACVNASRFAGFATSRIERGARAECGDGTISRVIAEDEQGRCLVSEVRAGSDGISLETEVVGVRDGSCAEIISEFESALEAEGVIASGPPRRAATGGVAQLEASRRLIRRQPQKRARTKAKPKVRERDDAGRRSARRLNRGRRVTVRKNTR